MTDAQREALHIARYALTRVVDVHVNEPGDPFPPSLFVAISAALEEIDEALPVGDLGEKPIRLRLPANLDPDKWRDFSDYLPNRAELDLERLR